VRSVSWDFLFVAGKWLNFYSQAVKRAEEVDRKYNLRKCFVFVNTKMTMETFDVMSDDLKGKENLYSNNKLFTVEK